MFGKKRSNESLPWPLGLLEAHSPILPYLGSEALLALYPAGAMIRLLDINCGVWGAGGMGMVTEAVSAF